MSVNKIIWVKPFNPENHNVETEGRAGRCGWHGTNEGTPCGEPPYASVKFNYADFQPVYSACARALRKISEDNGFPIPPSP
ncbi:hypothetical protein GCM10009733_042980 [Nonomuraea maheshkhaliensis]|uniref:Uncharacterized protein n=1 Tax=Nonomuraea maheshkhaliensis TaxID=419590 RepID=A0ABN2FEE1_9ACTN